MKIFVLSPIVDVLFDEPKKQALAELGDVNFISDVRPLSEVTELYDGDEPRILAIDPDFCDWNLPNEVIDKIPNLQAICLQTTSFSWIDKEHAKQKGIPVTNLVGFSAVAVAEWATLVVLALARRLPVVIKDGWKIDYTNHRGVELRGKTAGVIGLGRIGTAFAEDMAGLGMNVQYWSNTTRDERFNYISLEQLMSTSDVVLLSTANNDQTKQLLTDELVTSMKRTAIFMTITNTLYDQKLMLNQVKSGKIYGYGFEDEKQPFGAYEGNVWNGPALAWCTDESMRKNVDLWINSIENAVEGKYPTQVNNL